MINENVLVVCMCNAADTEASVYNWEREEGKKVCTGEQCWLGDGIATGDWLTSGVLPRLPVDVDDNAIFKFVLSFRSIVGLLFSYSNL